MPKYLHYKDKVLQSLRRQAKKSRNRRRKKDRLTDQEMKKRMDKIEEDIKRRQKRLIDRVLEEKGDTDITNLIRKKPGMAPLPTYKYRSSPRALRPQKKGKKRKDWEYF
jgi:SNF2 family DNA or RNA helicase